MYPVIVDVRAKLYGALLTESEEKYGREKMAEYEERIYYERNRVHRMLGWQTDIKRGSGGKWRHE